MDGPANVLELVTLLPHVIHIEDCEGRGMEGHLGGQWGPIKEAGWPVEAILWTNFTYVVSYVPY